MKQKLTKILGYILLVTFVVLAVLFVLTAIPATGLESRVVYSGSMEPALPTGAVAFTAQEKAYEVGDVVTFQRGSAQPVTHRIIEKEAGQFVTRGDANEDPDVRRLDANDISGAVFFHLPYIGFLLAG